MKMTGALIGAAVLVAAMTGCSAQTSPGTTSATSQAIAPASVAPTTESTTDAKDAAFLAKVHAVSPEITYSDPELIAYGVIACAQLQAGSEKSDITVISGDGFQVANENGTIVGAAKENLCP